MEWVNILAGIITFLVFAIGLPLALRKRKKSGPQNVEQLLHHLQEIGVKASLAEKGVDEEKVGASRSFMRRSESVIKIEGRNIDYINVSSVSSQYGVNYFLDYLVRSSSQSGQKRQKKTRMVRKKSPAIWGRVVDIEWKGDVYLSQQLNLDYRLKDIVLQTEPKELKSNIVIFPEPKHEYARVRTAYLLPSPDLFEAIDIIAKYIKSG
ncbi:hypothetical protein ES708_13524 [subsurface metagenome]|jgi:hypothetical protein